MAYEKKVVTNDNNCLTPWDVQSRQIYTPDGPWFTLYAGEGGGRGYVAIPCDIQNKELDAAAFNAYSRHVVGADLYNQALTGDTSMSIRCRGDNEHTPCVLEPIPINTLSITHGSDGDLRRGDGIGEPGGPQFTISCSHSHAVAYEEPTAMKAGTSGNNQPIIAFDRAAYNQGQNAKYDFEISETGINSTLVAKGPSGVAYEETERAVGYALQSFGQYKESEQASGLKARDYKDATDLIVLPPRYIVRRLTPTECARLQGFADRWGYIELKKDFTDEEYAFWLEVRNTYAAINDLKVRDYTKKQMLTWYNKLQTDSSEYKMWGNGIALPPALYCMQGIADALNTEEVDTWML